MSDIFYVPKDTLESLVAKVAAGTEITEEEVQGLTSPMDADDEALMIPVDMRGAEGEYEDIDELVSMLGAKKTVEAFQKAREYFDSNTAGDAEEDRAVPMSGKQLKEMMLEMGDEGEEEEDEEADQEVAEPPSKKAKKAA
mmetsp:Transcript_47940/g.113966  ORF Transcript_47940/g.113966 Transcript_47940/m.113966 type:complete len:140 (+) Transcript_47940:84-503(+)